MGRLGGKIATKDLIVSSTGVYEFGGLNINGGDNTKFDVGVIKGYIVDNTTDPEKPTYIEINDAAVSGITPTLLGSNPVTYLGRSVLGLVHKSEPFTASERRTTLVLGVLVHSNNLNLNAINNAPITVNSPLQQLIDIADKIGIFNGFGNKFIPNGSNLKLNKSAGEFVKMGVNYENDPLNPNIKTLAELISVTFRYRNQNSVEGTDITDIDPNTYDLAGVDTPVPNNRWTIQYITVFSSNIVRIQKGQAHYSNRNTAIRNVGIESFVVEDNISQNGLTRCCLVIQEGTTNINNATFIESAKFQNTGTAGTPANIWSPTAITLGDGFLNGATVALNSGAGVYMNFAEGADNEVLFNISLDRNGVAYDGTPISVELYWMKFGASGGTVNWELDYTFVEVGDNAYSKVSGNLIQVVDVTSLTNQTMTSTTFATISGAAGSKILQVTGRRNSSGVGADTYAGEVELYGFNLEV